MGFASFFFGWGGGGGGYLNPEEPTCVAFLRLNSLHVPSQKEVCRVQEGFPENRGPYDSSLNRRILIVSTAKIR